MNKKRLTQAASLLMCAAVVVPSYSPVAVLAAAETPNDTQTTTTGENPSDTDTGVDVVPEEGEGTGEENNGVETVEGISIYYNGSTEPMVVEKDQTMEDFVKDIMEQEKLSFDAASMRMDMVDNTGKHIRVLTASDVIGSSDINTVQDLYEKVKEQTNISLVVYTDTEEVLRVTVAAAKEDDIVEMKKSEVTPYKVTFNANGGKLEKEITLFRAEGETISYLDAAASYDDHTFAGWFDAAEDGNEVTADTVVTADMEIFAHWNANSFQITFDSQGGSEVEPMAGYRDTPITELPTPTREGYEFVGWFSKAEGGEQVTSFTPETNTTLYAQWKAASYQLTFDSCGGSAVEAMTGSVETPITKLPEPTREGYKFAGWFTKAEGGEQITSITLKENTTLYAHWSANGYQLLFDSQGGSAVNSMLGDVEKTLTDFPEPTREGYKFLGWFDAAEGGEQVTSITLKKDTTLYAQWEAISYRLNFSSQGGNVMESMTGTVEDTLTNFPTPEKAGYAFEGWFTEAEGGEQVTSIQLKEDTTLYAHWKKATVVITLDDQNGNKTTVDMKVGTRYSDFPTPTRDGYKFLGWYTEPDGGNKVIAYSGSTDITFYAHWEKANSGGNNNGNTNNGNTNSNNNGNTNNGNNGSGTENPGNGEETQRYVLTVISETGTEQEVTVNDDVQLSALAEELGYDVADFSLQTSAEKEHFIDGGTTMKAIAEKAATGEVLLIGYDSNGDALGSAKVTKTGDTTFRVVISKDTNVTLDGKGVGEDKTSGGGTGTGGSGGSDSADNTVAQGGKQDAIAEGVQTGDVTMVPMVAGMGGFTSILFGISAFLKKRGFIR